MQPENPPCAPMFCSSFNRPGCKSFYKLFLHKDIEDQHRDRDQRQRREQCSGLAEIGPIILLCYKRQCFERIIGQRTHRQEKLVPGCEELPDHDYNDPRFQQRTDDLQEQPHDPAAVDQRGLFQIIRDRRHESLEDRNGKGNPERCIREDQTAVIVDPPDPAVELRDRHYKAGDRDHKRTQQDIVYQNFPVNVFSGESEYRHARAYRYESDRCDSYDHTAHKVSPEFRILFDHIAVVLKCDVRHKKLRHSYRIVCPKRHADHKNERYHKDERGKHQNDVPDDLIIFF